MLASVCKLGSRWGGLYLTFWKYLLDLWSTFIIMKRDEGLIKLNSANELTHKIHSLPNSKAVS